MLHAKPLAELNLAESYRDDIERLVGEDLVQDALDKLQDFVRDLAPQLRQDALILRRSFSSFTRDVRRGIAKREDVLPIISRILEFTNDVYSTAAVRDEFKLALPSSATAEPLPESSPRSALPQQPERCAVAATGPAPDFTFDSRLISSFLPMQRPAAQPSEPPSKNAESAPPPAQTPPQDPSSAPKLVPANDPAPRIETLDDVKRSYWEAYRRDRPRRDTVVFAAKDVTKTYGRGTFKLEPISFELRIGEITGVVGRNASGKTTLLRIVMGDLRQDSGMTEYPLLTRDRSGWAHIKRQISDVPQFPDKWPGRLRPNLNYVAAMHGIRGARNKELIDWHIERFGLAQYEDASWDQISGGYKIRFELVRALVSKPKLLVLDEPLAYLDVMARQEFLKNLRAIAASFEEPVPIIITSQHLYEIEAIADQMILLDDGRCVYAGPQDRIGAMVPNQMIEITVRVPQQNVVAALSHLNMHSIEATMEGFILGFDRSQRADAVYQALYNAFGARLIDFRDISNSARSLFEERRTSGR